MDHPGPIPRSIAALVIAVLTVTLTASAVPARAAAAPASGCADVEVVAARGTGEQGTTGVMGAVAAAITRGTSRTVATYGLPYPATSDFLNSAGAGVTALRSHLTRQASACPAQRFVLLGYSQGAWVVGDALAGSGSGSAPVSRSAGAKVAAVVLYGDPRFVSGEPFTVGTSTAGVNGMYPRARGALSAYASRIRSYCYADDTVCQNGASGQGHFRYWQHDSASAAAFALSRLSAAAGPRTAKKAAAARTPAGSALASLPPGVSLWDLIPSWFTPFG